MQKIIKFSTFVALITGIIFFLLEFYLGQDRIIESLKNGFLSGFVVGLFLFIVLLFLGKENFSLLEDEVKSIFSRR